MSKQFRVLDLFSGIGGFSLGLERTGGFRTVAFCEIEPFCQRVLRKHWPDVPIYDDVRTLTAERLAADGIAIDVICGGFPCQDVSLAGRRAGLAGDRSGLWRELARLVGELRPRLVVVENTAGLLSLGMGDVLGSLAALRYDAEWASIPTGLAYGHRRERVWVVAYPDSEGLASAGQSCPSAEQAGAAVAEVLAAAGVRGTSPAPDLVRNVHGIPNRAHRITALGNAVTPQIPELIGRAILGSEA